MSPNPINEVITDARSALHGDYVSTSRVADTLLDLRSLASEDPGLVGLIDQQLASMPGRSVVPNSWWVDSLDAIAELAEDGERHLDPLPG